MEAKEGEVTIPSSPALVSGGVKTVIGEVAWPLNLARG